MCGISGLIGCISDENRSAVARMNKALAHRGPDGDGYWESPPDTQGWGVLLAHRRLAILDLTAAATQPMVHPEKGHVIVFNGEIYNYRELKKKLISEGRSFHSTGDTEVMLDALSLRG